MRKPDDICKCGHSHDKHERWNPYAHAYRSGYCAAFDCKCDKFTRKRATKRGNVKTDKQ